MHFIGTLSIGVTCTIAVLVVILRAVKRPLLVALGLVVPLAAQAPAPVAPVAPKPAKAWAVP